MLSFHIVSEKDGFTQAVFLRINTQARKFIMTHEATHSVKAQYKAPRFKGMYILEVAPLSDTNPPHLTGTGLIYFVDKPATLSDVEDLYFDAFEDLGWLTPTGDLDIRIKTRRYWSGAHSDQDIYTLGDTSYAFILHNATPSEAIEFLSTCDDAPNEE